MATFVVEFDIDNSAFGDDCNGECARILRNLADTIEKQTPVGAMEHDDEQVSLFDINGNWVGEARVE